MLSIVAMYLAISMGMKGKADFMLGIAAAMPDWLTYTPMGLTVRAHQRTQFRSTRRCCSAALLAQVGVIVWLGVRLLRHQLRHGVVAGGARDAAREPAPTAITTPRRAPARVTLSAVQRRELTLLCRDRNFLVQSLVLPLLIVGGQLLLGSSGVATSMWKDPNVLASVAFGLAAYSLSMSAFQTLNTEGHALWLLYTFPRSIEEVLKDKAKLWGVITLAYPVVMFAIGAVLAPTLDWKFLGAMLTAFLGIPIYAFIAVALGVFGSNPLEQQQNHKVKPAYVYLYMSLAALYVYAIVTPNPAQRLIFMVLSLLLAFALWQKARDQLPYLLDPDASPPARVSTSDGLIAAMLFFVAQAVAGGRHHRARARNGRHGAHRVLHRWRLTYALMRSVYAKAKTEGVPRILGRATTRPLLGMTGGLAAAAVAMVYLFALRSLGTARRGGARQPVIRRARVVGAAAGGHRGAGLRGVHFPRADLRRPAPQFRGVARNAGQRCGVRHHPSAARHPAGVRARRVHGAGVRTHAQPAGADDGACGVQRLRNRPSDSFVLSTPHQCRRCPSDVRFRRPASDCL